MSLESGASLAPPLPLALPEEPQAAKRSRVLDRVDI